MRPSARGQSAAVVVCRNCRITVRTHRVVPPREGGPRLRRRWAVVALPSRSVREAQRNGVRSSCHLSAAAAAAAAAAAFCSRTRTCSALADSEQKTASLLRDERSLTSDGGAF